MDTTLSGSLSQINGQGAGIPDWVSVVFGLIGIIGTIYTYLSWRTSRNQSRLYSRVMEEAQKSFDAQDLDNRLKVSRRRLSAVAEELETIRSQRAELQREVQRAVLVDRRDAELESMKHHFDAVRNLDKDLAALGSPTAVSAELMAVVAEVIQPGMLIRERRSNLKTVLSLASFGAAIASAVVPQPYDRIASVTLLSTAIPLGYHLLLLTFADRLRRWRRGLLIWGTASFLVVACAAFAIGLRVPWLGLTALPMAIGLAVTSLALLLGLAPRTRSAARGPRAEKRSVVSESSNPSPQPPRETDGPVS